ncbi:MAG: aminoacetone oxidase family FAD-binding enzyme [Chloroflexota bacterium]|nr:aminoacetone oxidase family FAD-binding enzyme [Chloroflexota bacterium]
MSRRIGIVGAGAAGMMAALEAARRGAQVLLFDTNPMVGRKLLVTGGGRCNISNRHVAAEAYTCADRAFLETAFALWGHERTIARLEELGIPTYATHDGWCYPLSDSGATVAQAFAAMLHLAGVEVHLKTKISDVRLAAGCLILEVGGPSHTLTVDRAVVATGGKAYPALGSGGDFFSVLERLGHRVLPVRPALAPVVADVRRLHKLQGVRLDVGLTLLQGDDVVGRTAGNMMFTNYGLSGPAAMDLSHLISTRPHADLTLSVDLLHYTRDALLPLISRFREKPVPLRVILGAVLPVKIPPVLINMAGLRDDVTMDALSASDLEGVLDLAADLSVAVKGTRGFEVCQLSTGGVPVTEVEAKTMASRVIPHLHLAGEVLDVVGPCGGYNLQFALTSGALAGAGAAG